MMMSVLDTIRDRCSDDTVFERHYEDVLRRVVPFLGAEVAEFDHNLLEELATAPDPIACLVHLRRFLDTSFSARNIISDFTRYPALLRTFIRLTGYSSFLADLLVRDAELFRWLTTSGTLRRSIVKHEIEEEIKRARALFESRRSRDRALRRIHRRNFLRIAARDILGESDLHGTVTSLTMLAESFIDAAIEETLPDLAARFEFRPECPFVVMGLGKLGGAELNYSSDIDLICLYDNEERTSLERHQEFFSALVQDMVRFLSGHDIEGFLYRVDLRLRPEGGAGLPAISLPAAMAYYESRGSFWERQMLIKARPVAGDRGLGERFLELIRPFVYPRSNMESPGELFERIHADRRKSLSGEENVKHRRGGIRDIEFLVQALQMLHGPTNPSVRCTGTIPALDALVKEGYLSEDDGVVLRGAYTYLRKVEHLLQLERNVQTYDLPSSRSKRISFVRKLGLEDWRAFQSHMERLCEKVSVIQHRVFARGKTATGWGSFDLEGWSEKLCTLGFQHPNESCRVLRSLVEGSSGSRFSRGLRRNMENEIDGLLERMSPFPSPDSTLKELEGVLSRQDAPEAFFKFIQDRHSRDFLLSLTGGAPAVARKVSADPLVWDCIFSGQVSVTTPEDNASLFYLSNLALLSVEYFKRKISLEEYTRELARVADAVVRAVVTRVGASIRENARLPFTVLALGKLGSGELTPFSDLDLVFIYVSSEETEDGWERVVADGLIGSLRGLFEIDLRLRPEGKNAPIVVEQEKYLQYLRSRAGFWERQMLTRARFVAGPQQLCDRLQQEIDAFVYEQPVTRAHLQSLREMREKIESKSRSLLSTAFDLKSGAGGIVDIEFAAQAAQLVRASSDSRLRGVSMFDLLKALAENEKERERWMALHDAYVFYRHCINALRLFFDTSRNRLPGSDEKRKIMDAWLAAVNAPTSLERISEMKRKVRQYYEDIINFLLEEAAS